MMLKRIEDLSVLVDPRPLVLTAAEASQWAPDDLRRAPTVTVLVGDGPSELFDVQVDDAEPIREAVDAHPLATLALAVLLRTSPPDVWAGIVAESATYAALLGGREFRRWLETPRPSHPSDRPRVRTARDGDELRITLDRPDAHNALDRRMRDELVEALQLAASDDTVRVVLDGNGPSFSSGGDLAEFGMVIDPPTAHAVRLTRHPGWWMHACAPRAEARVHGACIGAGIEIPAFAARVTADPDAFFALPEVGMGLVPGAGGTVSVTRRIGRHRCAWLAMTGARIDAPTALEWGLIDEIRNRRVEGSGR